VFVGRSRESSLLHGLLDDARGGESRVLVVRGEPGVGKTALVQSVVSGASGWRVVRTVGVESEVELGYAALHQLCGRAVEGLERLPAPQRDALGAAFGLTAGTAPERFLVGLAVLSLLSSQAEEGPLLCIIDDAQWLDRESAQVLAFVARRLLTDPIVMLFVTRDVDDDLRGLPELVLEGLTDEDADVVLSSVVHGPLNPQVHAHIIAETQGNPLALIELPRGLTPADLAVGFGVSDERPLPKRIEATFARRIDGLPPETQRLLLIAAADQVGQADKVWRAADILGIGPDAADPAADAELLEIDDTVRFRHPLVRSSAYRTAPPSERRIVHQALAEATDPVADPDRRAWHLAAASIGPDDTIADELERSAARAQERGGMMAAAAFLERSAEFTRDLERQALRRLLAAGAFLQAGAMDRARELLVQSSDHLVDPGARAQAMRMEGALRFADGRGGDTPSLLFGAAIALRSLDPRSGDETMMEAAEAAMWAADLTTGTTTADVASAARTWYDPGNGDSTASLLLHGYSQRMTVGYPAPVEWWRRAVEAGADDVGGSTRLQLLGMLWNATGDMLDFEHHMAAARERVRQARQEGALATLPIALACLAWSELLAGRLDAAEASNTEGTNIADATGMPEFPGAHGIIRLGILAWRGGEQETRELAEAVVAEALERGQGLTIEIVKFLMSVVELGLGRYEEALKLSRAVFETDPWYVCSMNLGDLIEAAVRSDDLSTAHAALSRLSERAQATQTPWGLGLLARGRALMASDEDAEALYLESLEQLGRSGVVTDFARTRLLYGEWLRRQRRRREARDQLRAAYETFLTIGAGAFTRRVESELLATGEHARARTDETRSELTPQELQVALLAADGQSNVEIAAQLYISAHTVSYHLRKVYAKLDVKSRSHLVKALADTAPV
jgi:DNA-binding CsgD family transcriptional regulator